MIGGLGIPIAGPCIPFGQYDLIDVIDQKVEELVGILLHIVIELLLLLSQPGYELFGRNRAHLLLLRGNAVEQIRQTRQQRLLGPLVLGLVLKDLLAEWLAKVEGLQHRVAVAGVPKVHQTEVVLIRWEQIGANLPLQLRHIGTHAGTRSCSGTPVQK